MSREARRVDGLTEGHKVVAGGGCARRPHSGRFIPVRLKMASSIRPRGLQYASCMPNRKQGTAGLGVLSWHGVFLRCCSIALRTSVTCIAVLLRSKRCSKRGIRDALCEAGIFIFT